MDVFFDIVKANVMTNDFLSRNNQVAELVKMQNLRKAFYENQKAKNVIYSELKTIENTSKYQKNKLIARNLAKQLEKLSHDSEAPDFTLKDKNGKTVKLSDYKNTMVLLQFVDRRSSLTEHEFAVLNDLQRQWNDTIEVITIATAESFQDYVQMFDNKGFKWQLLNLGDNILLLEDYKIKMCPAYVILKKNSRIGMSPAPSPDHDLEKHVRRISKYL